MIKLCDCGKPANESGYCDNCQIKIREQIDRELQDEQTTIMSDYLRETDGW